MCLHFEAVGSRFLPASVHPTTSRLWTHRRFAHWHPKYLLLSSIPWFR